MLLVFINELISFLQLKVVYNGCPFIPVEIFNFFEMTVFLACTPAMYDFILHQQWCYTMLFIYNRLIYKSITNCYRNPN